MVDQIIATWRANLDVEKVLLMGGFADSLALRTRLHRELKQLCQEHRTAIKMLVSE
jgi:hypothetical protein